MARRINYTHAAIIFNLHVPMSLLPSHRIGLMYDRAPIRDPVACEQPFGGRGGELSPHPRARMLETWS